ncbi:Calmodulin-dependent protein kinase cmk2 [Coemansia sp. RSA 2336]|nr:Calmodulin-dependent protein kinase cmk2 [Coemansia sp. RSA 2336]
MNKEITTVVVNKSKLANDKHAVPSSIGILQELDHPNIAKLVEFGETEDAFQFGYQISSQVSLYQHVCEHGRIEEDKMTGYVRSMLQTIKYLHDRNLVHCHLNTSSFVLNEKGIVLAEFDRARILQDDNDTLSGIYGVKNYIAPEIYQEQPYGKPIDMWALGTIVFASLCGYHPFWQNEVAEDLLNAMVNEAYSFDDRYWKDISQEAKDFIRCCLNPNPEERITAEQALNHPWFSGN